MKPVTRIAVGHVYCIAIMSYASSIVNVIVQI